MEIVGVGQDELSGTEPKDAEVARFSTNARHIHPCAPIHFARPATFSCGQFERRCELTHILGRARGEKGVLASPCLSYFHSFLGGVSLPRMLHVYGNACL